VKNFHTQVKTDEDTAKFLLKLLQEGKVQQLNQTFAKSENAIQLNMSNANLAGGTCHHNTVNSPI
jgi:hypothetical protein